MEKLYKGTPIETYSFRQEDRDYPQISNVIIITNDDTELKRQLIGGYNKSSYNNKIDYLMTIKIRDEEIQRPLNINDLEEQLYPFQNQRQLLTTTNYKQLTLRLDKRSYRELASNKHNTTLNYKEKIKQNPQMKKRINRVFHLYGLDKCSPNEDPKMACIEKIKLHTYRPQASNIYFIKRNSCKIMIFSDGACMAHPFAGIHLTNQEFKPIIFTIFLLYICQQFKKFFEVENKGNNVIQKLSGKENISCKFIVKALFLMLNDEILTHSTSTEEQQWSEQAPNIDGKEWKNMKIKSFTKCRSENETELSFALLNQILDNYGYPSLMNDKNIEVLRDTFIEHLKTLDNSEESNFTYSEDDRVEYEFIFLLIHFSEIVLHMDHRMEKGRSNITPKNFLYRDADEKIVKLRQILDNITKKNNPTTGKTISFTRSTNIPDNIMYEYIQEVENMPKEDLNEYIQQTNLYQALENYYNNNSDIYTDHDAVDTILQIIPEWKTVMINPLMDRKIIQLKNIILKSFSPELEQAIKGRTISIKHNPSIKNYIIALEKHIQDPANNMLRLIKNTDIYLDPDIGDDYELPPPKEIIEQWKKLQTTQFGIPLAEIQEQKELVTVATMEERTLEQQIKNIYKDIVGEDYADKPVSNFDVDDMEKVTGMFYTEKMLYNCHRLAQIGTLIMDVHIRDDNIKKNYNIARSVKTLQNELGHFKKSKH